MNRTLFFAALISVVAALPAWNQLDNYSFDQFLADFKLKYHPSELTGRKALFETELKRVQAHNAQGKSWKETVTKFAAMTTQEKKAYFGRNKGMHKALKANKPQSEKPLPADFQLKPVNQLPANVDWRSQGIVSPVKDQGHCGSCWAFASTAVVESYVAQASGLLYDLSVQQMAMCAPNPDQCGGSGGCNGATAELAFEYVSSSTGLFQEYQYSYVSYYGQNNACALPSGSPVATINGYVRLAENNYTALMNAIAQVGPVAISVDASAWSAYHGGIFDGCNQEDPDIDHAVVLVGYGEDQGNKYWLVRNSWSPGWGEKGYIRVRRTDDEEGRCGMDTHPQDGTACAGDDTPVKVCGTCGILYDSSYPLNAQAI